MSLKEQQIKIDAFIDDKVSNLDQNVKIAIVLAAVVLPLAAFYFLSWSPYRAEMKKLQAQEESLRKTITEVEAVARNIHKHRAEMAEAQVMFDRASGLLPQQQEIPALLARVSDLGKQSGLVIESFKPGGESLQEFYAKIPVAVKVAGPYHSIGVFLDNVSKMSRIVTVENMAMGSPKNVEGEMILKSGINLATYRFITPEEAAARKQQQAQKGRKRR
ncbi:MAG: type 4a pilus biogenesis protein PilO [Thermodesulfobacteriota bacterium]